MTTEERIKATIARRPDRDDLRTSRVLGVPVAAVRAVRAGLSVPEAQAAPAPAQVAPTGLVSLDRIRQRYDIKDAILLALAKLPHGKLLRESDLCQMTAGSDRNRFRRAVENNADAFRDLRVRLRLEDSGEGTYYWGRREDVTEAVRMRDL